MQLDLNAAETELLQQLLDHEVRELSLEIADTNNSHFRDELRGRRDAIRALLDRVGGPLPDPTR